MLVFDTETTLGLSYVVFYGNSDISKNNDTSVWNLVPNSELQLITGKLHSAVRRRFQVPANRHRKPVNVS